MHAPPAGQGRIPGYDLALPGEADVVSALDRVFGAEQGTHRWREACRVAGVFVGRVKGDDQLGRAVKALATQDGASAAVARSIEIRMRTYARLAARAKATTTGGQR